MNRIASLAGLTALVLVGGAWSQEGFSDLLLKDSLAFRLPAGFSAVAVVDNPDLRYQFAIKSSVAKAEIRYSVFPASANEQFAASFLQAICLNLSNGRTCPIQPFAQADVRTEFGADYGFTSITTLGSGFGKGYAYGMVNLIHKNGVADVVTVFLVDDRKVLQSLILREPVFHALRFK